MEIDPSPGAQIAASEFATGAVDEIAPFGSGHINETYRVTCATAGLATRDTSATPATPESPEGPERPSRFILQRVNRRVFRDPVAVMRNIERVTAHIAAQVAGHPDAARRVLALMPARNGKLSHVDAAGEIWRAYRFIAGTQTFNEVASATHVGGDALAFRAARAFGRFQKQLANLPDPPLGEPLPYFHHTPRRFAALERAIASDACGRARETKAEIAFVLERRAITGLLMEAKLPVRTTHNDTKLNNLLFDEGSGEAICVIDLDTVIPGLALNDFGDMVRTMTCDAAEDERDLARVTVRLDLFEAVARGYLAEAGSFLTNAERELLSTAGKLITFEQGMRFLADYLEGDRYYKVHRERQNLDRARVQFKLLESMEAQENAMQRLVKQIA